MLRPDRKIAHSILMTAILSVIVVAAPMTVHSQSMPVTSVIEGSVVIRLQDGEPALPTGELSPAARSGAGVLSEIFQKFEIRSIRKVFPWRTGPPPAGSGLADLSGYYELHFDDSIALDSIIEALRGSPAVSLVEPVKSVPVDGLTPNDPDYDRQWYHWLMQVDSAWQFETGSDSVKVAIIDVGVNYRHPDLIDHIWVNPGEDVDNDMVVYDFDDLNGVDNDGNGLIDDLIGYDFLTGLQADVVLNEDGDTPDSDPNDYDGHGTHIAGVVAGVTNNQVGIAGIGGGWYDENAATNRGIQIMCLRTGARATDGNAYVNTVDCAAAMDYAVMMGAQVLNCSWDGNEVQGDAIRNAIIKGVTIVHSAGNESANSPDFMDTVYPGEVLTVTSTRVDDHRSWFSNYGYWVDISAPGDDIYSTESEKYDPLYAQRDGTSCSVPMVAGMAALIRSMMPSLDKFTIDSIIVYTADDIDSLNPTFAGLLGSGRINVFTALSSLANAKFSADVLEGNIPLSVQFTDLSPNSPWSWQWYFGDGDGATVRNPSHVYTEPGVQSVSLLVEEPNGLGEEHLKNYIWVQADTLRIGSVEAFPGEQVVVPVYLTHTALIQQIMFSFTLDNDAGVSLVDVSLDGLRSAEYFRLQMTGYSPLTRTYTLRPLVTGSTRFMPPGSGPILNLTINVDVDAEMGAVVDIDTLTWIAGTPTIRTVWGNYWPESQPGQVEILPCCGLHTGGQTGNTNCSQDGKITLADITRLIDRVIISRQPLCCEQNGNTNGDALGELTLSDISRLIDHVFISRDPTAPCSQ